MKQKTQKFSSITLIFIIFLTSCDWKAKLAIIKNNTTSTVSCLLWDAVPLNDSLLYNDRLYMKYWIKPNSFEAISLASKHLNKAPDSACVYIYIYIYIYNVDSLKKYQRLKVAKGIFEHSLLKRIVVQLNRVREPLDTIYAR